MTSVARSRPELNFKEASWQHEFTCVPGALFAIEGKLLPFTDKSSFMSILDELPNHDKSTDSQQAERATVAGIYIRDSKGKNMMPSYFRPLPHPFVLYAPWIGGRVLSLGLGQPWPCLDLLPLLLLLFGIAFHLQLVLLSYHPIFLRPYHFLKLVSFLGANRTKRASVCLWLLRGAI